jgi:C-terminal processing protease CtpA/Prc
MEHSKLHSCFIVDFVSDERWMQIISVIAGGPCHGIMQAGDEILCVGDENVEGATLQEVSTMLATSPEDEIIFTIKRGRAPEYCI